MPRSSGAPASAAAQPVLPHTPRAWRAQVNVLAWLESVCADAEAAAALLNSALGPLLVRMLQSAPAPGLRVRLAAVLGLLVRHTAFIGPNLASSSGAPLPL